MLRLRLSDTVGKKSSPTGPSSGCCRMLLRRTNLRELSMVTKRSFVFLFALWGMVWSGNPLRADNNNPADAALNPSEPSVSFQRLQFTVSRNHGKVYIDGVEVSKNILDTKSKQVRLIETFDGLHFGTDRQFLSWAHKLRSTRTYTYDEVTQGNGDGSSITQPLVFFDKDQRSDLDVKWQAWLDKRKADIERANQMRLAQEQEAKHYQLQDLQTKALLAQTAAAEKSADSLAVISGATSLWEVELVPVGSSSGCATCPSSYGSALFETQSSGTSLTYNGFTLTSTFGSRFNHGSGSNTIFVKAYGRTSQVAGDQAVQEHPGYRVASIRRLAGY
jgi:hypothetical protein